MTEINEHVRCRGAFVNLDDVAFELVARTNLHYFLLKIPLIVHIRIRRVIIVATLFRLLRY
jgi:hypothetical protein